MLLLSFSLLLLAFGSAVYGSALFRQDDQLNDFVNQYEYEISQRRHYFGHQVIRVVPVTLQQLKYLHEIAVNLSDHTQLDFWRFPSALNSPVDIQVEPRMQESFRNQLIAQGLEPRILIHDLEKYVYYY